MKSHSNSKQASSLSSYIDGLIAPPPLPNPLKRSSSQKNINDSAISISELAPAEAPLPSKRLSPMKKRAHSEDTASQLFGSARYYADQQGEGSMLLSRISELTESVALPPPAKEVTFRENLIMRNGHSRRDVLPSEARTPSILKKSQLLRNNCAQFLQQNSHASSDKPAQKEDREERAAKTNEVVKRRYLTILQRLQAKFGERKRKGLRLRSDQRYQDDLFPPIASSVMRGGKVQQQGLSESIRWARISQLYKHCSLSVFNTSTPSSVFLKCTHGCSNFMGDAFNSIKNCKLLLRRMFDSCEVSEFGLYLVKIFQENVWKFVIVDDYIPVRSVDGQLRPAFLTCTHTDPALPFEIWPFLLEKAYANYYANYESLHFGDSLDFLEEVTGLPAEPFLYHNSQKKMADSMNRLRTLAALEGIIFLGFVEAENAYVPLETAGAGALTAYLSKEEATTTVQIDHVFEYFDKVFVINPGQWTHSRVSTIGINIRKNPNLSRFDISLRTLKVGRAGLVSLSVRQREKRLYQRSSLNYSYIWVRVLLLQREFDGDCRWVDAKYSNSKSINFLRRLEAGEYYVVLLPEWRSSHCYELSLLAQSESPVALGRREYEESEQLVERGCCDLAQRRGRMQQINLYACSYTLVSEQLGMLFENVNNERYQGSIRINRSIAGLKPALELLPFNREFYLQKPPNAPFNPHLSVYIPADHSYTVVLMMRGGIDLPFLRKFDFGR